MTKHEEMPNVLTPVECAFMAAWEASAPVVLWERSRKRGKPAFTVWVEGKSERFHFATFIDASVFAIDTADRILGVIRPA